MNTLGMHSGTLGEVSDREAVRSVKHGTTGSGGHSAEAGQ
jgi:hypothetical protein